MSRRRSTAEIPARRADAAGPFFALDVQLRYDSTHLRVVGVRRAPAAADALVEFNVTEPGSVTIAMASAQPIETTRPVLMVEFETDGQTGGHGSPHVVRIADN